MIHLGDCIEVMAGLPADSVDAVVTDPPYGLEFMGKGWDKFKTRNGNPFDPSQVISKDSTAAPRAKDNPWQKEASGYGGPKKMPKCRRCGKWKYNGTKSSQCQCEQPDWDYRMSETMRPFQAWCEAWGREALRVTKPGGYLLAFGGTRTHHRLVCGLEDAGWIIRDELTWVYASGFPKGKANLKPAHEPIVLARKPGPLRPLNIEESRISADERYTPPTSQDESQSSDGGSTADIAPWPMVSLTFRNLGTLLEIWSELVSVDHSSRAASEEGRGLAGIELPGLPADCPACSHCGDGLLRLAQAVGQASEKPQAGALEPLGLREGRLHIQSVFRCADHPSTWDAVDRLGPEMVGDYGSAYAIHCTTVQRPEFAVAQRLFGEGSPDDPFPCECDGPCEVPEHSHLVQEWYRRSEPARKVGPDNGGGTRCSFFPGKCEGHPGHGKYGPTVHVQSESAGRWPSNLLLSDPELFDEPNPYVVGSGATAGASGQVEIQRATSGFGGGGGERDFPFYGDSGGYSRFFIIPKADRTDREPIVRGQLEQRGQSSAEFGGEAGRPGRSLRDGEWINTDNPRNPRANSHPTVKPTDLMRHLVRLVTPSGGTVLDPFLGSGSTAIACELEGFPWIGIEKEPEYVAIAEARLNGTQRGLGLDVGAPTSSYRPPAKMPPIRHDQTTQGHWESYTTKPDEEPAA